LTARLATPIKPSVLDVIADGDKVAVPGMAAHPQRTASLTISAIC